MQLIISTYQAYDAAIPAPIHRFNSAAFAEMNREKCTRIHYLLFKERKMGMGIILGEDGDTLRSPFSAPFGGFSLAGKPLSLERMESAAELLKAYARERGKRLSIGLPPSLYDTDLVSKSVLILSRAGFKTLFADLNYHLDLERLGGDYEKFISRTARLNLHRSLKEGFTFRKAEREEEVAEAYAVIRANRASKGYPLRMSLEAVRQTIRLIPADFFLLSLGQEAVAAAQVFHVAPGIVQVIYWGDAPGYSHLRPMNLLPLKLIEYYRERAIRIIDVGPSTEAGIPNYGLCDFKSSIGCQTELKFRLEL